MLVVYLGSHDPRGTVTKATPALVRWIARMKHWPVARVLSTWRAGETVEIPGQRYYWHDE